MLRPLFHCILGGRQSIERGSIVSASATYSYVRVLAAVCVVSKLP